MKDRLERVEFDRDGLIPAVVQDAVTGGVLMLAYMNREALERTAATHDAWYWSRSRQRLWRKGEESGHTQRVREIRVDCDGDALLLVVEQTGAACHTGRHSCFHRDLSGTEGAADASGAGILDDVFSVIRRRRQELPEGSYTTRLFRAGQTAITAKVAEESEELIRAAREESEQRVAEEAADLLFHSMVLLASRGVGLDDVRRALDRRRRGR